MMLQTEMSVETKDLESIKNVGTLTQNKERIYYACEKQGHCHRKKIQIIFQMI